MAALALTIKPSTLDLLDVEEKQIVQWIKDWYADPEANGGLEVLRDCGFDMIKDLLEFLERYSTAHNRLRADRFLGGS